MYATTKILWEFKISCANLVHSVLTPPYVVVSQRQTEDRGSGPDEERKVKTEGIFVKCPECESALYKRELTESLQVCTHCDYHFRLPARERLDYAVRRRRIRKAGRGSDVGRPARVRRYQAVQGPDRAGERSLRACRRR